MGCLLVYLWICVDRCFGGPVLGSTHVVWHGGRLGSCSLGVRDSGLGWGSGRLDEPESLILAQSERWRHA